MAKNKYTNIDDDSSMDNKWKEKYLLNLKDLEKKEREWLDSEKNLRILISHLTKAADPSSAKLNKQLSVLRDAINDGVEARKLKKAIEEVEDSVLTLEAIRTKHKKDGSQNLINLIGKIHPAGKIEKKLAKIANKIAKTSKNKEVTPLINDLAKLLVYGLKLSEENHGSGFFSSLLGKKDNAGNEEKPVTGIHDEDSSFEANEEISEEENEGFEKTDAFSERYESEKDQVVNYVAIDLTSAIKSLQTLLDSMILPKDLELLTERIKQQLNDQADEQVFLQSLEETVVIVATVLVRIKKEKKEIEDFLKQLTGRLHELDHDIRETARIRELTHRFGIGMAGEMQIEMKTMEQGLKNINNIEELKSAIQSRVIMLRNHVDKFLLEEDDKEKQASIIIEQLKNKVKLMEEETEELREQLEKEREQTLRDALTGIANRLAYEERLDVEWANFRRRKTPFVLVVWDIDFFKKVNDEYGHAAGDQVLKLVAKILSEQLREVDFIARFGGEEFVSLLPDTDLKGAEKLTNKLREIISNSNFHFREKSVNVTLSAGFAEIKTDEDGAALFIRADKALYKAKKSGRNNCQAAL